MTETGKTCAPDWEALYQKAEEENAKLRMKLEYLDGVCQENQNLKAKLEMVYLIFGRE